MRQAFLFGASPGVVVRHPTASLVGSQVENLRKDRAQYAVTAVRIAAVLEAPVVAVFVTAPEAFAEVVVVLAQIDVVAVVTVRRILIREGILVIEVPTILTIRQAGLITLIVAVLDGLPEHLCAVLVRLVILAAAIIAIVVGA